METTFSSETSVYFQWTTRYYIKEPPLCNLKSDKREDDCEWWIRNNVKEEVLGRNAVPGVDTCMTEPRCAMVCRDKHACLWLISTNILIN
jgi:hypothetical protein